MSYFITEVTQGCQILRNKILVRRMFYLFGFDDSSVWLVVEKKGAKLL